jgi:hypothetical protein
MRIPVHEVRVQKLGTDRADGCPISEIWGGFRYAELLPEVLAQGEEESQDVRTADDADAHDTSCLRFDDDDALCRVKLQYLCSDGPRKTNFVLDYGNDWKAIYKQTPYTPSPYGIPECLRWKISEKVLCPSGGIVFDLTTGTRTGIDTSLMYVKQNSLQKTQELFWVEKRFYFRLESHTSLLPSVQIYREGVRDNW